jgi:hypothetical protein
VREVIEIAVRPEDLAEQYIRLVTQNSLTSKEYELLTLCSSFECLGRAEKKIIRDQMNISTFNLNNLISALKKKGYLLYDSSSKTYSLWVHLNRDVQSIEFIFNLIE